VQFLFASNVGSRYLPIKDVASGGELSRLTLCTKSLVADAIPLILSQRGANCAEFLAKRILLGFVTPEPTAAALQDLKGLILANQFRMGDVFKALFNSAWFYAPPPGPCGPPRR
jgi:hypothetical protein